ncbi:hypothetical protein PVAND_009731 [Polypedilum vanderplanki]|uniref:Protein sleepless n=1 Tax=Polypedilum vanderplanki TaxID=319348 RepID=A0A9J6CF04_POLVA|nr:hypothetical protein PVAND_009731 [Polypedilum vanderplanki]
MKIFFVFIIFCTLNLFGVDSIKCYQCSNHVNSINFHINCADPFAALETLSECPLEGGQNATLCRKLRQTIDTPDGKLVRITRSCGYIPNEQKERDSSCFRASFTSAAASKYCTCNENACNKVDTINKNSLITIIFLLTALYGVNNF